MSLKLTTNKIPVALASITFHIEGRGHMKVKFDETVILKGVL